MKWTFTTTVLSLTGGGGIDIGYSLQEEDQKPMDNVIVFHSCNIENNTGQFNWWWLVQIGRKTRKIMSHLITALFI